MKGHLHIEQGSPNIFEKGPHKLWQHFEGRVFYDYVMWLFRDMSHSTQSAHVSSILYFFIFDKMCSWAGWNDYAGRIWPVGHSLETPDIE